MIQILIVRVKQRMSTPILENNIFPFDKDFESRLRIKSYTLNSKNNNRLVIFGDSFAEPKFELAEERKIKIVWQKLVSEELDCSTIVTYARGGTSLYFSLQSFYYYMQTNYRENDIILFFKTSHNRLPVLDSDATDQGWQASLFQHMLGEIEKGDPRYEYFKKNTTTFNWIEKNLCTMENNDMYKFFIDGYLNGMKNKTMSIDCFKSKYSSPKDVLLADISFDEFDPSLDEKQKINRMQNDTRINHLTVQNHKVLATQIVNFIKYGTELNKNKFDKHIIK